MLLEIENELYRRVHEAVGETAVVVRLAEDLESSGSVAENTNIVVSFSGSSTDNPHKGAYIPTVRRRSLNYNIIIVQKQSQRQGHSFALPILDVIADYVTGWVPCIKGLQFQTGFELTNERFMQITEASQYVYEQSFTIEVLIPDGRMVSSACAISEPLCLCDYMPTRTCLLTQDGLTTSLAIWTIRKSQDEYEDVVTIDPDNCAPDGELSYTCNPDVDGAATYTFVPASARIYNQDTGLEEIDESKIVTGTLTSFMPCMKKPPCPRLRVYVNLWINSIGKIKERSNPRYSHIVVENLYLQTYDAT
jgi:hypothetical protein